MLLSKELKVIALLTLWPPDGFPLCRLHFLRRLGIWLESRELSSLSPRSRWERNPDPTLNVDGKEGRPLFARMAFSGFRDIRETLETLDTRETLLLAAIDCVPLETEEPRLRVCCRFLLGGSLEALDLPLLDAAREAPSWPRSFSFPHSHSNMS